MTAPPRATAPQLAALPLAIATARLRLRPIAEDDVDALWPHVTDPEVPRWMSWRPHGDRAETLAYVRAERRALADNHGVAWVIEEAGALIGTIGLRRVQWSTRAWAVDRAELGYWLGRPAWGGGRMTEAARAVTAFAFTVIGLHKLTSGCIAENHGSRRVLAKLGFRALGVAAQEAWIDGAWRDHLLFELLADDWRAATAAAASS